MANTISKGQLKARMREIFRQLESRGEELIVTDHNRPVLKIVPIGRRKGLSALFGDLQGQVIYHEEIDTPTRGEWDDV